MSKQPTQLIELPTNFWESVQTLEAFRELPALSSNKREVTIAVSEEQLQAIIEHASQLASGVHSGGSKVRQPLLTSAVLVRNTLTKRSSDASAQARFRQARAEKGLKEVRGIWADPVHHQAIKDAASPLVGADGWVAAPRPSSSRAELAEQKRQEKQALKEQAALVRASRPKKNPQ